MASGTDALRFALVALGLRAGDEVITVPHTFIATTEAITQAGGVIRFVDVDEQTMTLDPHLLEAAIGTRTVGILPVHLYGHPCDMDPIMATASKHGLWVLEDACQAHLARQGVGTGLHYPVPLHLQRAYLGMGFKRGSFPVAERTSDRLLSLPMFAELSEAQVDRVASGIRSFYGR